MRIVFEYRDERTRGRWSRRECWVRDKAQAIEIYGLGTDCEYRILEVDGRKVGEPHDQEGTAGR